jgi:outer membrane protein assembly factor BamE (lipoprotein component of BamABCDE complex)
MAAMLALTGCIPVPVPVRSEKDPVPYTATDLSFIKPGVTTRDELVAALGQPMVWRRDGQLAIYGTVQRTGTQAAWILFPFPVPVGLDAHEQVYHLVIQFDASGAVARFEGIETDGCASDGICIENAAEKLDQAYMQLETGRKVLAADQAIVYDMGPAADAARASVAGPGECLLFIAMRNRGLTAVEPAYFRLDGGRASAISPRAFAMLSIAAGSHAISAGGPNNPDRDTLTLECPGSTQVLAEIVNKHLALRSGSDTYAKELAGLGLLLIH